MWRPGPLHAGVQPLVEALDAFVAPPAPARLDALAARLGRPLTASGRPVSFAPAPADGLGYEARVAASGCVATRDSSWHDTFNACVWMTFPRSKAAMNQRHCDELAQPAGAGTGRGRVRDALTQFDEDGLVMVSDDAPLLDALRRHRWREAMWERRAGLEAARLFVFGHALLEKALAPHAGLCAKVRYVDSAELGVAAASVSGERADAWLAAQIAAGQWPRSPRDLHPLPVLGLPGMTPDNVVPTYFDDTRQFRPQPARLRPE